MGKQQLTLSLLRTVTTDERGKVLGAEIGPFRELPIATSSSSKPAVSEYGMDLDQNHEIYEFDRRLSAEIR